MAQFPATLSIGFQFNPDHPYHGGSAPDAWGEADRLSLKAAAQAEIHGRVGRPVRNEWNTLWIDDADGDGHIPENQVRAILQGQLDRVGGGASLALTPGPIGNTPNPHIVYVYVNDKRYCLHAYQLNIDPPIDPSEAGDTGMKPDPRWYLIHEPVGKARAKALFFATLSWASPA